MTSSTTSRANRPIRGRRAPRHPRRARALLAALATGLVAGCATPPQGGRQAYGRYDGRFLGPIEPYFDELSFDPEQVIRQIDIYFDGKKSTSGLMASFSHSARTSFSNDTGKFHDVYYRRVGYLEDQAFTYDLALAAIGLLLNGRREQAERILDALERDFYLAKNGTFGLYNAYRVSSNIPVDDLAMGGDGDRMHAGPTLWVAFAALNHAKLVRNTRYLEFTLDIVNWCRSELTYYRFPDGERGAISMGMGWGPDWNKIFSTEHNVDYFSVLQMLKAVYDESPREVRQIFEEKECDGAWLKDEMDHVGRWLREVVFDPEQYVFRSGVNENGVDPVRILDGTSWGLGGVGPENFAAWGIDMDRLVENSLKLFTACYELENGEKLCGIDFTDPAGYDNERKPLFWFEGTGQLVCGLAELARYHQRQGDEERAARYARLAAKYMEDMHRFSEHYGLKGTLPYMAIRPPVTEIVKTLKWEWEIPRGETNETWVESMSSTMWYLYCAHGFYNTMRWN